MTLLRNGRVLVFGGADAQGSRCPRPFSTSDARDGLALGGRPSLHRVSEEWVRGVIERAEKRAGLPVTKGKCHKLRHPFCTRPAMAGAAPRTIQALAGHVSIETTMRYMHVAKAAPQAIAALDARLRGGAVEAGRSDNEKLNETAK